MEPIYTLPETALVPVKVQTESMLGLAGNCLSGIERLSALNLTTTHAAIDAYDSHAKAWIAAEDLDAATAVATSATRMAVEGSIGYWKALCEVGFDLQAELNRVIDARSAEFSAGMSGSLEAAARSSPAGVEATLALVKQVLDAADAAYANLHGSLRKLAEAAEAQVCAAAAAALGAVNKVPRLGMGQRAA
ncbi:MAG: TIGR01841 family phasin [Rhodocyclaceae bacterium]|nr:TIGR01841 family phasin [Rhodocyclaceae bacterium]MBX3667361.1 TIGR01841 family phasin [Rhodocyclaceae bacterium]